MANSTRARLQYLKWNEIYKTVKPYAILGDVPEGVPDTNLEFEFGPEQIIRDMRGREEDFTLDESGFAIRSSTIPPSVSSFDAETIKENYLPYVERLLHQVLGEQNEIHLFDWRLRTSNPTGSALEVGKEYDPSDRSQYISPVETVHIDQRADGAMRRLEHHLGSRAKELSKNRIRIINVWRPLRHPVWDFPLAVCDAQSVPTNLLVKSAYIREEYHGESLYPLYSDQYQWYYLSQQKSDEVLIFKSYDSAAYAKTRGCPHTSFRTKSVDSGGNFRESIEVRALVISPTD